MLHERTRAQNCCFFCWWIFFFSLSVSKLHAILTSFWMQMLKRFQVDIQRRSHVKPEVTFVKNPMLKSLHLIGVAFFRPFSRALIALNAFFRIEWREKKNHAIIALTHVEFAPLAKWTRMHPSSDFCKQKPNSDFSPRSKRAERVGVGTRLIHGKIGNGKTNQRLRTCMPLHLEIFNSKPNANGRIVLVLSVDFSCFGFKLTQLQFCSIALFTIPFFFHFDATKWVREKSVCVFFKVNFDLSHRQGAVTAEAFVVFNISIEKLPNDIWSRTINTY